MFHSIGSQLKPALILFLLLSAFTGLAYPVLVTVLAQFFFPVRANGSLVFRGGVLMGSEWIGQDFRNPKYFWPRPSATSPDPYNAMASGGSNLGPSNPEHDKRVANRIADLRIADRGQTGPVPADLVTASGSGLDPHLSPAAAAFQIPRVAKARGLGEKEVADLVDGLREGPVWGFLGEPRVNVLLLNLALDDLARTPKGP
jgi:K+-transporting ATPase ATPase C chain